MTTSLQRFRAVLSNLRTQDVAEYAVMLAVIVLLVIGAFRLNGGPRGGTGVTPPPVSTAK